MAAPGVDPLEKSVNSAEIPSMSEALNLWETEKIDHSVLNYYYEHKSPNAQLSQKPQTRIFTVNLEPSKHFTSCRASFISFEVRLVKLPDHEKLPPIHPQPSLNVPNTGDVNLSTNDNVTSSQIDQSEARLPSPSTQHECIGNKFVLDNDELHSGKKRFEEKKERYEMEKKKKQERMRRWIEEQEEYRRRWQEKNSESQKHKMHCKRKRDLTTGLPEHDVEAKRRKMLDQREFHDRKRKRQTDCPTDRDIELEMRKKRKKEEEKEEMNIKDDPNPEPVVYPGSNLDNAAGR